MNFINPHDEQSISLERFESQLTSSSIQDERMSLNHDIELINQSVSFETEKKAYSLQSENDEEIQLTDMKPFNENCDLSDFLQIQISNPNITKNIIKSYFKFLINQKNKETVLYFVPNKKYQDLIRDIKKYIKRYKFNNKYLARLLQSKGYNKIFEYYLTFDISDWLVASKISNIQQHQEIIEFLKECCVKRQTNQQKLIQRK
ncbi:hypothetical protein ABPG72_019262 [Tetrahymena utriculariae]